MSLSLESRKPVRIGNIMRKKGVEQAYRFIMATSVVFNQ